MTTADSNDGPEKFPHFEEPHFEGQFSISAGRRYSSEFGSGDGVFVGFHGGPGAPTTPSHHWVTSQGPNEPCIDTTSMTYDPDGSPDSGSAGVGWSLHRPFRSLDPG